jgi:hypothetical protein
VLLGQRRAAGGHGPFHTRSEQPDHIGVPLAHHHLVPRDDVVLGPVQGVQGATFRVDGRLGGVLVLGRVGTARQDPPAERHRVARRVADREQHPGPEGVLELPPPVDERQARAHRDRFGQGQGPAQLVPTVRGPSQTEPPHHVPVVAAAAEVVTGLAGVGAAQQALVVPLGGLLHGVPEHLAPLAVTTGVGVLPDGDAGLVGQSPHRIDEIEVLGLPDEGDGVALGLTPEAVVEALVGVDAEGRGLLPVEGTQAHPAATLALQCGVLPDEGDDVGRLPDPGHVLVGDAHRSRRYRVGHPARPGPAARRGPSCAQRPVLARRPAALAAPLALAFDPEVALPPSGPPRVSPARVAWAAANRAMGTRKGEQLT